MTVTQTETVHASTETSMEAHVESTVHAGYEPGLPEGLSNFLDSLGSGDHKDIGRNWVLGSLFMGVAVAVVGLLVGFERLDLGGSQLFQGSQATWQAWTFFRIGLILLVMVPLFIGLATAVTPLQVGASSISYPRLAAMAFWTWLVSGSIFAVAHAIDGGFVVASEDAPVELAIASLGFMALAILLASVCIVTTVITQRTVGMDLGRVPMFSWSMLVAAGLWILSIPVLLANLVVIWIDHQGEEKLRYADGQFLWAQVSWITDQPQVFLWALPLLGIAGDILPVGLTTRPRAYGVAQAAIGAFGLLSFGAWAQSFFSSGVTTTPVYVLGALSLALPVVIFIGWLGDSVFRSGGPKGGKSHSVAAFLAVAILLLAGAIGFVRVLAPLVGFLREFPNIDDFQITNAVNNLDLTGTSASGAVFAATVAGGLVGALAGLWFWAPKIFGTRLVAGLGGLAALSLAGAGALMGLTDLIAGFFDQPDLAVTGDFEDAVGVLNAVGIAGRAALLAGLGLGLLAVLGGLVTNNLDDDADVDNANPWGANTLEWATPSPPPPGNFAAPIPVRSPQPLRDLAQGDVR